MRFDSRNKWKTNSKETQRVQLNFGDQTDSNSYLKASPVDLLIRTAEQVTGTSKSGKRRCKQITRSNNLKLKITTKTKRDEQS